MFSKISRPKWWLLYLLLPVLVGLLVIESKASISDAGHRVVEVGIVLLVFGLIELWLRGNDANIRAAQWRAAQGRETRRVIYTSQGQFVTIKKADPQPASVTPARITETAPVERSPKPTALADNTVLEPIGSLSSPLSKSAPYANSKALAVLGFVTRRS
jgi:hypothetical protein